LGYSIFGGSVGYDYGERKNFDVTFTPGEILAGGMTQVDIKALDCQGLEASLPSETEIFLLMYPNLGDFVRDGNEILDTEQPIPYGDFQAGRISIRSYPQDHQIGDEAIPVQVLVFLTAEARINGWDPRADGTLMILRKGDGCPYPQFAKAMIAQGETVQVSIRRRNSDGTLTAFPAEQRFDVRLWDGSQYGSLVDMNSGLSGTEMTGITQPLLFVASQSLDVDSIEVTLTAYLSYSTSSIALKKKGCSLPPKLLIAGGCNPWASVWLKPKYEILLGETKYYRAKVDPNDGSHLLIAESSMPVMGDGIPSDVWGESPVAAVPIDRPGVYWEKEKPLPNGAGLEPLGLIRLVGRYWSPDFPTKVSLTASSNGATGTIEIEVKKPNKLGDTNPKITDVSGKSLNLDSLIIIYAGANGIPPQLIKGQIEQETHFIPSWRYEPFQDAPNAITSEIFRDC
jgi:hypothetical protein